jgi:hypothetical protein
LLGGFVSTGNCLWQLAYSAFSTVKAVFTGKKDRRVFTWIPPGDSAL